MSNALTLPGDGPQPDRERELLLSYVQHKHHCGRATAAAHIDQLTPIEYADLAERAKAWHLDSISGALDRIPLSELHAIVERLAPTILIAAVEKQFEKFLAAITIAPLLALLLNLGKALVDHADTIIAAATHDRDAKCNLRNDGGESVTDHANAVLKSKRKAAMKWGADNIHLLTPEQLRKLHDFFEAEPLREQLRKYILGNSRKHKLSDDDRNRINRWINEQSAEQLTKCLANYHTLREKTNDERQHGAPAVDSSAAPTIIVDDEPDTGEGERKRRRIEAEADALSAGQLDAEELAEHEKIVKIVEAKPGCKKFARVILDIWRTQNGLKPDDFICRIAEATGLDLERAKHFIGKIMAHYLREKRNRS